MKQTWQKSMLAVALSAAAGLAFAQQPGTGTNMQKSPTEKDAANIIDRQTQPPRDAGTSSDSASESKSGQGAGASQSTSGQIIDRQTKPSTGPSSSSGEPSATTTERRSSSGIIDEQTKPGTGKIDPAQRSDTTR